MRQVGQSKIVSHFLSKFVCVGVYLKDSKNAQQNGQKVHNEIVKKCTKYIEKNIKICYPRKEVK